MTARIQINGFQYEIDLGNPIDVSIPLAFNGPQPNAFGAETATSEPCKAGDIVGDTRRGGSCNFEQYTLIAHCNGTHTECVGHITHERILVRECLRDVMIAVVLVSIEPDMTNDGDTVITWKALVDALPMSNGALTHVRATDTRATDPEPSALIVRTLPNDDSKLSRKYDEQNIPPYFSTDAMEFIVESGFKHLLVDMPSIDRLFDDGKLANHRIFWNVKPGSFETHATSRICSTITELIYVPNEVANGEYLLNLQIAPFDSDATPSRPILFKKH